MACHRPVVPLGGRAHEGAVPDARLDQAALLRLHVAAGNGSEIDVEPARELALRRQAVRWREPSVANVLLDCVGDREIARLVQTGEVRHPACHYLVLSSRTKHLPTVVAGLLKLTVYCCAVRRQENSAYIQQTNKTKQQLRTKDCARIQHECCPFNQPS